MEVSRSASRAPEPAGDFLYLDNAATSHPKPRRVAEAMLRFLDQAGSPGRSAHRLSKLGDETVWRARELLCDLFAAPDPSHVVFTQNATMAMNIAINGLAERGRMVTSAFEHNSVARPLYARQPAGQGRNTIPPGTSSPVDLTWLAEELGRGDIGAVIVAHASNVIGAVVPLPPIAQLCRAHQVPLIVDAAQSAGHLPVSMTDCDILVFSGHKGLLGPQGTGGLVVGANAPELAPLILGGTGGRSEEPAQPRWLPHRLEAGTHNGVGIAGLAEGVEHIRDVGIDTIRERESELRAELVDGIAELSQHTVLGWPSSLSPSPVVSFETAGLKPSDVARKLEDEYHILARAGLHCAPMAHETIGTLERGGTVRMCVSFENTSADVKRTIDALSRIGR
jgi:cysteine desulfurase / selenocysteine lyase